MQNEQLNLWKKYFDDRFYLELIRTNRVDEEIYIQKALQLASETQTPVVATNEVMFMNKEGF